MVGYLKPNMVIRVLMSLLYFNNSYCICHSLKTQRATHAISYASNIVPQCLSLGIPGERRSHLGPQMYVCVRKAKISIVLYSPCRNSTCVRAGIDPLHSAARQKQRSLHHTNVTLYGVRSRRTHLFGDQLWRADAGSWQIADRYTVASSAAHRIAVGDFRVHFVVEL